MRKVLIIAYYFPPMAMSGIQRTLKFVKYLSEYGWEPTVVTVSPHAYFAFDDSFLGELEGRPVEIWRTNPAPVFKLMGNRKTISLSNERLRRAANRLSQLLFVPDNKIGWKNQVLSFLAGKDLSAFELVYATAPPFTDHLIGLEVKRRFGLPLVVDFRDAWIEYPYHKYWTPWHRRRHLQLEAEVVRGADAIVTTNEHVKGLLAGRHGGLPTAAKIHVITQGFDAADFAGTGRPHPEVEVAPDEVSFVYTGVFYEDRDPKLLYDALARLKSLRPELYRRMRFYMVGYVQEEYRQAAEAIGVGDRFVYCGYVGHDVAVAWLKAVDVAWFNIGAKAGGQETVSPGKAFEYLGSGKPILAIIPRNEIREMLATFDHATIVDPGDEAGLVAALTRFAEGKIAGTLPTADPERIGRYDRRRLTGRLAQLFASVVDAGGAGSPRPLPSLAVEPAAGEDNATS